MKTRNKNIFILLYVGLAFLVVGGSLAFIGQAQGGQIKARNTRIGIFSVPVWSNATPSTDVFTLNPATTVTTLNIDANMGDVQIRKGASFSISTSNISKEDITFKEEGNIASLQVAGSAYTLPYDEQRIDVTIPDGFILDVNLDIGDIDIMNMNFASLTLDLNAGDVDIEHVSVDRMEASLNLGDFDFTGDILSSLNATISAGDCNVELQRESTYYDYNIKTDVGRLSFNDSNIGAVNSEYTQSNNTGRLISIKMNLGSVDVEFLNNTGIDYDDRSDRDDDFDHDDNYDD